MNAPVHHRNGGFLIRELHASAHLRGPHVKGLACGHGQLDPTCTELRSQDAVLFLMTLCLGIEMVFKKGLEDAGPRTSGEGQSTPHSDMHTCCGEGVVGRPVGTTEGGLGTGGIDASITRDRETICHPGKEIRRAATRAGSTTCAQQLRGPFDLKHLCLGFSGDRFGQL